MREIIVTKNFNQSEPPIGKLLLMDGVEIPYNSVFALGGIIHEKDKNGNITKFELVEVSLIPDDNYIKFLEREKAFNDALICLCHCHSDEDGKLAAQGIQCKCIKNCEHCHPENFQKKEEK